jgi:hypothetical protein
MFYIGMNRDFTRERAPNHEDLPQKAYGEQDVGQDSPKHAQHLRASFYTHPDCKTMDQSEPAESAAR